MSEDRSTTAAIRVAATVSALVIAFQVAGRAARDALFLAAYPGTMLPAIMLAAAAASLVTTFFVSDLLARFGPVRVITALFLASAVLLVAEWGLIGAAPGVVIVVVYLHFTAIGALLVSGFWSAVNERFDPRTAKRAATTIVTAGTVGGLGGGLVAEGLALRLPAADVLPFLAALHLAGALLLPRLAPRERTVRERAPEDPATGMQVIAANGYVRTLVLVVLFAAVAEELLTYVFRVRSQAYTDHDDARLLALFAAFYTAVNLLSVAAQAGLTRRVLARLGLARTVGVLPWVTAVGSAGALALPGVWSAMAARGAEGIARNSLYRSGCELLFTPLPAAQKRAAKPLIDVGVLRIGDVIAGILLLAVQLLPAGLVLPAALVLAVAFAAAGITRTRPLHAGYVAALERSLVSRAVQLDLAEVQDETTRSTLLRSLAGRAPPAAAPGPVDGTAEPHSLVPPDPVLARIGRLRARNPAVVRQALAAAPLDAAHVPHAVALLAWDEVSADALRALAAVAPRHCGQLVDALLDEQQEFSVRRRLPDALASAASPRAVEGLLAGLADRRFEVRFRCGRALARVVARTPELALDAERVYAAVVREAAVDRQVWESQRLLDRVPDDAEAGFVDEVLRDRVSRSLEHVFTVLSLALPRQPLQIAFRGLFTTDAHLRGTALEYLEAALPVAVREALWPYLDDRPRPPAGAAARPRDQVVADLLRSRESIALNLAAVRRRAEG